MHDNWHFYEHTRNNIYEATDDLKSSYVSETWDTENMVYNWSSEN
jgi:hypothetical protein